MGWQWSLVVVPTFLAAAASFLAAGLVWQSQAIAGKRRLLALLGITGWWSLLYGLGLLRTDLVGKTVLYAGTYLSIALVPVVWLLFVVEYLGRDEWVTERRVQALLVVPAITLAIVATNEPVGFHTLFWTDLGLDRSGPLVTMTYDYGPWFWIHSTYSYVLLTVSAAFLLRLALFSDRIMRAQAAALVLAVGFPVVGNLVFLAGLTPPWLDTTNIGFFGSAVVFAVTVYRYRLLTVVPAARQLARSELIETTPDPVLVVDDRGAVIDLNPAATGLFDVGRTVAIGRSLDALSPELAAIESDTDTDRSELAIGLDGRERYFDVQITGLASGYGVVNGRLVSLRDVTERRQREQRLSVFNRLLRHDLRNVMTTIYGNAEVAEACTDDPEITDRMDTIEDNVETLVARRDKFDRVLSSIDVDASEPIEVVATVAEAVETARGRYPHASIHLDAGSESWIDGHAGLELAVEELIENAILHTDDPTVRVAVSSDDDTVTVTVCDDGPGIPAHELEPIEAGEETPLAHASGVGLWLVEWVVGALGGSLDVDSSDGTRVRLRFSRREG